MLKDLNGFVPRKNYFRPSLLFPEVKWVTEAMTRPAFVVVDAVHENIDIVYDY
jgi:hypothetical protein